MRMLRAFLVYNPAAGRYPSRLLTERAAKVLLDQGWEIFIEQTLSSRHIAQLATRAVEREMDAFIVVGGDGSINQALPALIGSRTALGVLPAGTANVWAQELGLPGLSWTRWMALEESARRLINSKIRYVDVGFCNQRPFLMWAGVGLDAFIVHRIEPRTRWEKHFAFAHYAASAIWSASMWHGLNLKVSIDGDTVSGHFLMGVVSNIHLYAGGLAQLSPDARLDDGQMDFWLFKGETIGDVAQRALELWSGYHTQSEMVERFTFQNLMLASDSPMYVQMDGEPMESPDQIRIQIRSKALRVLVPELTPLSLFE